MPSESPFPPSPFEIEEQEEENELLSTELENPLIVLFERFATLHRERQALKRALEENQKKMERLQQPLRDFFLTHPKRSYTAEGGITVFLKREIWVHPRVEGDKLRVCEALRQNGLGHYVHDDYNASSLSKYVRDLEKLHADDIKNGVINGVEDVLPPDVTRLLDVEATLKVQGRRKS